LKTPTLTKQRKNNSTLKQSTAKKSKIATPKSIKTPKSALKKTPASQVIGFVLQIFNIVYLFISNLLSEILAIQHREKNFDFQTLCHIARMLISHQKVTMTPMI
jgi:hypothetical protein